MPTDIHKSILLALLTCVGLIVLPHIYQLPVSIFSFFAVLLIWRFIGVWYPQGLPNKLLVFVLTIAGVLLLYSEHHSVLGRDPGTSLFIIALALKLLEIKRERELYLIIYLAFIVAASQFLYQQSILITAYILLVSCALLATLILINSHTKRYLLAIKTASLIVAQALPLTLVLFMLFPRVESPRWMLFENKAQAKSGLSDSMEPGSISDLALSDELAFRVKFKTAIPPIEQRYWRGPVFSYTDGKRWLPTMNMSWRKIPEDLQVQGQAYNYTLMIEPQEKSWVYGLDLPKTYPATLNMNVKYQLISKLAADKRAEYTLTSYPIYNTGDITNFEYRHNLQLPDQVSQEVMALLTQLNGLNSSPRVFINNLLAHFKQENFTYTLTPPLMENDPIDTFLFKTRTGFCSHYAAAFVYLMRAAKIPSRVVTGYQGGEFNKVGGFFEVRQANAHAWAEVWLKNEGWVRFDPTAAIAPQRIAQNINIDQQIASGTLSFIDINDELAQSLSWLKSVRQLWGTVDYSWQSWVLNYTPSKQSSFLSSLGISNLRLMIYWMVGLVAAFTLAISWLMFSKKQKIKNRALRAYLKFCEKLRKVNLNRKRGEGPNNFAQRAKFLYPEQTKAIDEITSLFVKIHYHIESTDQDLEQLEKYVSDFKFPLK